SRFDVLTTREGPEYTTLRPSALRTINGGSSSRLGEESSATRRSSEPRLVADHDRTSATLSRCRLRRIDVWRTSTKKLSPSPRRDGQLSQTSDMGSLGGRPYRALETRNSSPSGTR